MGDLELELTAGLAEVAALEAVSSPAMLEALARREAALRCMDAQVGFYARCVKAVLAGTKTKKRFRVAIVGGAGAAGSRVASGLLAQGCVAAADDLVLISRPGARTSAAGGRAGEDCGGATRTTDLAFGIGECSPRLIVLAFSAAQLEGLAPRLRPLLKPSCVVCSLLAGVSLKRVGRLLGVDHVVGATCAIAVPALPTPGLPSGGSAAHARALFESAGMLQALYDACELQAAALGVDAELVAPLCRDTVWGADGGSFEAHFDYRFAE